MRVLLAAALLLALAAPARAGDEVGVVVVGDAQLQPAVTTHLENWLRDHGHTLASHPLSASATESVTNCLLIADDGCAAGVIDKRGHTKDIVFARITRSGKTITFDGYWFVRGRTPVGEHRTCEDCTEDAWHGVVDLMMSALEGAASVDLGRLAIASKPSGLTIMLDHVQIGVTPLERDLPTGPHEITLMHAGRRVGEQHVTITHGTTAHVSITANEALEESRPSRVPGGLLLAGGIAATVAGATFLYLGTLNGPDQKYLYPDATQTGIGLAAVGIGAGLVGAILLAQSGHHSAPVASVGRHGAYIGWITRF